MILNLYSVTASQSSMSIIFVILALFLLSFSLFTNDSEIIANIVLRTVKGENNMNNSFLENFIGKEVKIVPFNTNPVFGTVLSFENNFLKVKDAKTGKLVVINSVFIKGIV